MLAFKRSETVLKNTRWSPGNRGERGKGGRKIPEATHPPPSPPSTPPRLLLLHTARGGVDPPHPSLSPPPSALEAAVAKSPGPFGGGGGGVRLCREAPRFHHRALLEL
ncbi:hypothetical protein PVAP13_4KG002681 [Panicum virgatum]|uniref:Uncharacterized protein n=1 Tax=Panicum virgatum TaxID=38727 RepID=A0A8T0TIU0_PANVG|nr:hypothetical protein PVAP13_4KG002681 [Panicum virgatum]